MSQFPIVHDRRRIQLALAYGAAALVVGLVMASGARRPVLMPVAATGGLFLGVLAYLHRRAGILPISEIGIVYLWVISIYTCMPLVGFVGKGLVWGPESDFRLYGLQPVPEQVGAIGWQGFLYALCFAATYLAVRGPNPVGRLSWTQIGRPSLDVIVALVIALSSYFLILGFFYDLRAKGYAEEYLKMQSLPLFVAQITNHMAGMLRVVNVLLLLLLFTNYRNMRGWIALFLGYQVFATLSRMGSRTEMIIYCMAAVFMYHGAVRPLTFTRVMVIGVVGLAGVLVYGVVRDQIHGGNSQVNVSVGTVMTSSNEFESVFATAVELNWHRNFGSRLQVPIEVYAGDLLAIFPQQLLPIGKMKYEEWYLRNFYPEVGEQGGGFAFGALAEAAVGYGYAELVIRAALLGLIFGGIHRWYSRQPDFFWPTAVYLWMCLKCYESFRVTSFVFVSHFIYGFVPIYLLLRVLELRKSRAHVFLRGEL